MDDKKEKDTKVIIQPSVTRKLLQRGHIIVDVKRNKYNKDATVHVFKTSEKFWNDLEKVTKKIK